MAPNPAYDPIIAEASKRYDVPEPMIRSVMRVESGGQRGAVSPKGASGLMQVMPETYRELAGKHNLGPDRFEPRNNILAGTAYLRENYDRFGGDWGKALAAYNAGPGAVASGRPLPKETQDYVPKVQAGMGLTREAVVNELRRRGKLPPEFDTPTPAEPPKLTREAVINELRRRGKLPPEFDTPTPAPAPAGDSSTVSSFGEAWRGFQTGIDQVQGAVGAGAEMLGRKTGLEGLAEWGEETRKANNLEAKQTPARVGRIEDIHSVGDAADYAAYTVGTLGPQMGATIAGGVLGTLVGGPAGGIAGLVAPSYVMNTGEVYDNLLEKGIDADTATNIAAVAGIPMAAMDAVVPGRAAGRLTGEVVSQVAPTLARKVIQAGGTVLKDAGIEGLTETGQEAVGIAAEDYAGVAPTYEEAKSRLLNSAVAGAIGGGGIAAVTVPFESHAPAPGVVAPPATAAPPAAVVPPPSGVPSVAPAPPPVPAAVPVPPPTPVAPPATLPGYHPFFDQDGVTQLGWQSPDGSTTVSMGLSPEAMQNIANPPPSATPVPDIDVSSNLTLNRNGQPIAPTQPDLRSELSQVVSSDKPVAEIVAGNDLHGLLPGEIEMPSYDPTTGEEAPGFYHEESDTWRAAGEAPNFELSSVALQTPPQMRPNPYEEPVPGQAELGPEENPPAAEGISPSAKDPIEHPIRDGSPRIGQSPTDSPPQRRPAVPGPAFVNPQEKPLTENPPKTEGISGQIPIGVMGTETKADADLSIEGTPRESKLDPAPAPAEIHPSWSADEITFTLGGVKRLAAVGDFSRANLWLRNLRKEKSKYWKQDGLERMLAGDEKRAAAHAANPEGKLPGIPHKPISDLSGYQHETDDKAAVEGRRHVEPELTAGVVDAINKRRKRLAELGFGEGGEDVNTASPHEARRLGEQITSFHAAHSRYARFLGGNKLGYKRSTATDARVAQARKSLTDLLAQDDALLSPEALAENMAGYDSMALGGIVRHNPGTRRAVQAWDTLQGRDFEENPVEMRDRLGELVKKLDGRRSDSPGYAETEAEADKIDAELKRLDTGWAAGAGKTVDYYTPRQSLANMRENLKRSREALEDVKSKPARAKRERDLQEREKKITALEALVEPQPKSDVIKLPDKRPFAQTVSMAEKALRDRAVKPNTAAIARHFEIGEEEAVRVLGAVAGRSNTIIRQTADGRFRLTPRQNGPQTLIGLIASRGGLAPDGDLSAMDLDKLRTPGAGGMLVRKGGMTLDAARELAEEEGFLGTTDDYQSTTVNDFLQALDAEHRGSKVSTAEKGSQHGPQRVQMEAAARSLGIQFQDDWSDVELETEIRESEAIRGDLKAEADIDDAIITSMLHEMGIFDLSLFTPVEVQDFDIPFPDVGHARTGTVEEGPGLGTSPAGDAAQVPGQDPEGPPGAVRQGDRPSTGSPGEAGQAPGAGSQKPTARVEKTDQGDQYVFGGEAGQRTKMPTLKAKFDQEPANEGLFADTTPKAPEPQQLDIEGPRPNDHGVFAEKKVGLEFRHKDVTASIHYVEFPDGFRGAAQLDFKTGDRMGRHNPVTASGTLYPTLNDLYKALLPNLIRDADSVSSSQSSQVAKSQMAAAEALRKWARTRLIEIEPPKPVPHPAPKESRLEALKKRVQLFSSGMTRPVDIRAGSFSWGGLKTRGIGIEIGELSKDGMEAVVHAVVERQASLFIDSGAFNVFMAKLRGKTHDDLLKELGPDLPKPLNFDQIIRRYDTLLEMIHEANAVEEALPPPLMVMPDVVGDQAASLELVKKYKKDIETAIEFNTSNPIVPIQKGDLSLSEAYNAVVATLGTDGFIVGIPGGQKAVTLDELREFLTKSKPPKIHILGNISPKTLDPKLEVIASIDGYDPIHVSADGNLLRSKLYGLEDTAGPNRSKAVSGVLKDHAGPEFDEAVNGPEKEAQNPTKIPTKINEIKASDLAGLDEASIDALLDEAFAPEPKVEAPTEESPKPAQISAAQFLFDKHFQHFTGQDELFPIVEAFVTGQEDFATTRAALQTTIQESHTWQETGGQKKAAKSLADSKIRALRTDMKERGLSTKKAEPKPDAAPRINVPAAVARANAAVEAGTATDLEREIYTLARDIARRRADQERLAKEAREAMAYWKSGPPDRIALGGIAHSTQKKDSTAHERDRNLRLRQEAEEKLKRLVAQQPSKPPSKLPSKPPPPAQQSAADILKKAGEAGVKGADEALTGLYKLFGGNKLSSGFTFDEDTYKAAKPHFQEAYKQFAEAGRSLLDFARFIQSNFGDAAKPYLKRFLTEGAAVKEEKGDLGDLPKSPDPVPPEEPKAKPPVKLRTPAEQRFEFGIQTMKHQQAVMKQARSQAGAEYQEARRAYAEKQATLLKDGFSQDQIDDAMGVPKEPKGTPPVEPAPVPVPGTETPVGDAVDAASVLASHGLKATRVTTKNGKPAWEISGNTHPVRDVLKGMKASWYGPKRVWTFWDEKDPSEAIAGRLGSKPAETEAPAEAGAAAPAGSLLSPGGRPGEHPRPRRGAASDARLKSIRQREDKRTDERSDARDVGSWVDKETQDLIRLGLKYGMPAEVVADQIEDVALIHHAYAKGKKLFLLANEAGTGKTFVLGAAMRELRRSGATSFVYVTLNQDLIAQIQKDLKTYGVDDVVFHTYSDLSKKAPDLPEGAVLIFDETHSVKDPSSARGKSAQQLIAQAKFTIFSSATPFENPVQAKYLAATGIFDPVGGHTDWAKMYGASVKKMEVYNKKTGKNETVEVPYWQGGKAEDGIAARTWMMKQGIMTQRAKKLPPGMVDSVFRQSDVPQEWLEKYEDVERAYRTALNQYVTPDGRPANSKMYSQIAMHRINMIKRILEASKVDQAIERAKHHLKDGKQVVIFVETKADREVGKFRKTGDASGPLYSLPEMHLLMQRWKMMKSDDPPPFSDAIIAIATAMHNLGVSFTLPSTTDEITRALGKDNVAIYTGAVSGGVAAKNKADFLAKKKSVLIATMAKGGTGLSLHDTAGDSPRVQVGLNLPWVASQVDQVSGRIARYGLQSKATIEWLFAGNVPFERSLAQRVGGRMRDMGALVKGLDLQAASILTEFNLEDETFLPEEGQAAAIPVEKEGEGGEPTIPELLAMAEKLERTRKKLDDTSGGAFFTPYPLAVAMRAIGGVFAGDRILEPSAGHGALVRFLPSHVTVDMIERRRDNAEELVRLFGKKEGHLITEGDFLELSPELGGDYDTILMNPPFEREAGIGPLDVAHVRRAYELLAEGGRLVAIMGEGAFFREQHHEVAFRDWLDEKGATVVKLPENVFKNSGTGVRARLVVIDERARPGRTDIDLHDVESHSLEKLVTRIPVRERERDGTRFDLPRNESGIPMPQVPMPGSLNVGSKGFFFDGDVAGDFTALTGNTLGFDVMFQPEFEQERERITDEIRALAERLSGGRMPVKVFDRLFAYRGKDTLEVSGAQIRKGPFAGLVALAMTAPDIPGSLRHEAIHFLRDATLLDGADWRVLEAHAASFRKRFAIDERYGAVEERILNEEGIAEAYKAWGNGEMEAKGALARAFAKLKRFFEAVKNLLAGNGFTTANSIFQKIETGEMARADRGAKTETSGNYETDVPGADGQGARYMLPPRRQGNLGQPYGGQGPAPTAPAAPPSGPVNQGSLFSVRTHLPDKSMVEWLMDANYGLTQRVQGATSRAAIGVQVDRLRQLTQDRFIRLRRVQEAVTGGTGRAVPQAENAYLAEELFTSKAGEKLFRADRDHKTPILEAIHSSGLTVDQVEKYLYARHATERNARISRINPKFKPGEGSGMTDTEAAGIVNAFRIMGLLPQLDHVASLVDAMNAATLQERVNGGLMSAQEALKWQQTYKHYVPLRGLEQLEDAVSRPAGGQGYNVRGPESQRAMGRQSRAESILGNVFMMSDEAIIRAEKNRVVTSLMNLVQNNADPLYWQVDKVAIKPVFNKVTGLVEYRATTRLTREEEDRTVRLKVNGHEHRITIHDARLMTALKNLEATKVNMLVAGMMKFNRYLATMNTALNPEFLISNAFRDLQAGFVNMSAADLKGLQTSVLRDYGKALKGAWNGIHGKSNTVWGRHFRDFAAAGGRVAFYRIDDLDEHKTKIDLELRRKARGPWHVKRKFKEVFDAIQDANAAVDNGIRLAVFVNAKRLGKTDAEAASLAKNLTINFNRRGELGPVMNSAYLFFNASVQGTAVLVRALKHKKVRKIAAGIVVAGFLLEMANAMISPDDDDGEDMYGKIPDFTKSRNFIIMSPDGTAITLPMPYGYNVFADLGRNLAALARGHQSIARTIGNILTTSIDAFNPIGGTSSLLNFVSPTILDPLVDLSQNQDFAGRKIMPETPNDKSKPDSQKYWSNTGIIYRTVAEQLNELTGGNEWKAGGIDVSPETLDYLMNWIWGSAGAFALRTGGLVTKFLDGTEIAMNDVPFARKVVTRKSPGADRSMFYERAEQIEALAAERKGLGKAGRKDEADALKGDLLRMSTMAENTRENLAKLRRTREGVRADGSLTPVERQRRLDEIAAREKSQIDHFNRIYVEKVLRPEQEGRALVNVR
jgi:hypothetical protein